MRVIIQAEALRRSEGHYYHHFIQALPTIDAVPVKHAEWINGDYGYLVCPFCGCEHHRRDAFMFDTENDYCPRCGAKMDGGAET